MSILCGCSCFVVCTESSSRLQFPPPHPLSTAKKKNGFFFPFSFAILFFFYYFCLFSLLFGLSFFTGGAIATACRGILDIFHSFVFLYLSLPFFFFLRFGTFVRLLFLSIFVVCLFLCVCVW